MNTSFLCLGNRFYETAQLQLCIDQIVEYFLGYANLLAFEEDFGLWALAVLIGQQLRLKKTFQQILQTLPTLRQRKNN